MKPVIHDASKAAHNALKLTAIRSLRLSGTIAVIPLKSIPTLLKLAKPHKA